jgi:hypothetical protein
MRVRLSVRQSLARLRSGSAELAARIPPIAAPMMPGVTVSWPLKNKPGMGVVTEVSDEARRSGVQARP